MAESKAFKYISGKATAWSKLSLPGWWGVFQYICGGILVVMLISGLFRPSPDADVAAGPPSFEDSGPVSTDYGQTPPTDLTPMPTDPALPADPGTSDPVVSVPDDGAPKEARALAEQGFKAMFDSTIARKTPVVGGGTLPAPASDFPEGTVEDVTFSGEDKGHYSFSATVDADGPGTEFNPSIAGITVTEDKGVWKVVR